MSAAIIDLFTTSVDGWVMSTWWEPTSGWAPWFRVSNGLVSPGSPVSAVSRHANEVKLFTVDSDRRVWTAEWQPIIGWSSWSWVGDMVCRAGSTVTAIARHANHVWTTFRQDGSPWANWWPLTVS